MAVRVRVWDLPVRVFHWLLVGLLGLSWWSGKAHAMDWHRRSGYVILALLVFRIFWGFAGTRTARFAEFVRAPRAVLAYARTLPATAQPRPATAPPRPPVPAGDPVAGSPATALPAAALPGAAAPGHNPIGGWSVMAMLLALSAMVGAGLFSVDVDGIESGPLADWVSFDAGRRAAHVHGLIFDLLLVLIALHIVAIAIHRLWLKHDLVGPMITGRAPAVGAETDIAPVPLWRLLAGMALAGAVAWAVSRGFAFAAAS